MTNDRGIAWQLAGMHVLPSLRFDIEALCVRGEMVAHANDSVSGQQITSSPREVPSPLGCRPERGVTEPAAFAAGPGLYTAEHGAGAGAALHYVEGFGPPQLSRELGT